MNRSDDWLSQIKANLESSQSKVQQIKADLEFLNVQPPQLKNEKQSENEYVLQSQSDCEEILAVVDNLVKQKLTDKAESILSTIIQQNSGSGEKLIEVLVRKGDWQTLWLMAQAAKKIVDINVVDKACAAVELINPQFWFAREFPNHARGYYSQCGQDKVIEQFFLDYPPKNKIFIEVGACDGVHYSNVRRLYETYGWTGICIEPVKRNFEKLVQSYYNTSVKCIRTAVGLEEGELDINVGINPNIPEWQSDVSTFLESETQRWEEEYGMLWEKEKVSIKRLTTILDEQGISEIDCISIDTEGFDFDVLKSLDFTRFHPSMIVIEYGKDKEKIISYLANIGYSLIFDNSQDLFLVRLNHLFSEIRPDLPPTQIYTGVTGHPPYTEIQQATENNLHELIGKSIEEIQSIVIVGGHLGFEIDRFLQNYPNSEIHVFEASQRYFSQLLERFAGSQRVFCHNNAVSDETGTAVFYETTLDGTGSLFPMMSQEEQAQDQAITTFNASPAERYTVNTVTLDCFAPLTGKQIDLLWCDVQGAELKVLKGAKQTLERCSSLFLEVWLYRNMYQGQCQLPDLEKYLAEQSIYLSGIGLNQSGGGDGNSFWLRTNQIPQKKTTELNPLKKIVALIETKNEAIQIAFCIRAVAKFVDAICIHDDVSDDNTVQIVKSLAKEYPIERIIRKNESWEYSETGRQKPLLDAGREIGGTHFVFIDADEAFTSNLEENDFLRKEILKLQPGDRLQLAWIQLWRSVNQYRYDTSVWTNNYKQIIFADDGKCYYGEGAFHVGKMPLNLNGKLYTIEGYNYGLLHFQFVNWRNLLVKQSWYRCLEHIRQPQKSIQEINSTYGLSKDETNLGLRLCPPEWFSGYPFFDEKIYDFPEQWREKQVLQWFKKYSYEYFSELDIWDIDWGNGLVETLNTPPSSFCDVKYHRRVTSSEPKDVCKILFYYAGFTDTSHIADGGAATAIISLATALLKSYCSLSVEITGDHISESHTYNGVKFLAFPQPEDREAFISIYDVVVFGAVIRTLLNIPKRSGQIWVLHHHCWYFESEDMKRVNDLDAILCLSELHRDAAISQGSPSEKTKICTNIVGDIFTVQPVARNKHSIMFAGAIVSDKGLHILLEALPIVHRIFPDAEIHVYGSASLWLDHSDSYEKDIKNVERNGVYFHGSVPRNEMPEIYSRHSILCLPSHLESFSLVSVEAQACGCIPVVHHVGGVAATLVDKKTGFLYSPNTEQELAKTIIKALKQIDSDDSIRQVAAAFAQESFSNYKVVKQLVFVLRKALLSQQYSQRTLSIIEYLNMQYETESSAFKVSAIVSTYNSEIFIRGCLQDLVDQTLYKQGELEIIVIDSDSPQNEYTIVREFQAKYPNIVYERTLKRETLYASWKRAIKMSRGVYITNANTDDRHRPDAIEVMANYLDTNPTTSLVYADQLISTVANETWGQTQANQCFKWPTFDYKELERQCICGPQPMWRKSLHSKYGYFRSEMMAAADYEFWLRIGKTEKLVHLPEILGIYYHNPEGLSTSGTASVQEPSQIWEEYGISRENITLVNVVFPISPSELEALPYRRTTQPLVSVIIPTKDRPEMLAQAVQSVLNQTFPDIEIIVINDGGIDVQNVLDPLNLKRNIIYLKHEQNLDRSAARNTGIQAASGKYIAYLDDDDTYYPNHVETLVNFLQNSEHKVAYTDAVMAEQQKQDGKYVTINRTVPYSLDFDNDKILVNNFIPILCLMHEKSCLDEAGAFDVNLGTHEDWDLLIRLSRKFRIAHIKETTCEFVWRNDGSTTTSNNRVDFFRTRELIYQKYNQYAEGNSAVREAQNLALQSDRQEALVIRHQSQPEKQLIQSQLESTQYQLKQVQAELEGLKAQLKQNPVLSEK